MFKQALIVKSEQHLIQHFLHCDDGFLLISGYERFDDHGFERMQEHVETEDALLSHIIVEHYWILKKVYKIKGTYVDA